MLHDLPAGPRPGRAWAGALAGIYMALAAGRIAVGLAVARAPVWFSSWIPAAFHVILAAFILALCGYHATRTARGGATA